MKSSAASNEKEANDQPITFEDVLTAEYRALRPESASESCNEEELIARIHNDPKPLTALCISGGGIRSATFSLGVLQGLAERGLLPRFDYLSTVSGGGYIGGWLTAWTHREGSIERVSERMSHNTVPASPEEPDPLQHLREYNSYLSPRTGLFSSDVWAMLATFVRNIILNWMVLIPLMMAVLMVPRLYLAMLTFPEHLYPAIYALPVPDCWKSPVLDAVSGSPLVWPLLPMLSALLLATALFFIMRYLPSVGGREHSRYDFSLKILAPLVGAVLIFLAFDSLFYLGQHYNAESRLQVIVLWTLLPCAAAWLLYLMSYKGTLYKKFRLLFGPMSLAIISMAGGTGVAIWVVSNFLLWNSSNPNDSLSWAGYVTIGPPAVLLGFVLGTILFVGLSSRFLKDEDREWMARAIGTILLFCVSWAGICAVVLLLPHVTLEWSRRGNGLLAAVTAASAWLSTLGGTISGKDGKTKAWLLAIVVKLAPPVFLALLAGALSIVTNMIVVAVGSMMPKITTQASLLDLFSITGKAIQWRSHDAVLTSSGLGLILLVMLVFVCTSVLMARWININTFSLHGMYRDRLVRAYLGASHSGRKASPFTGFAANDDIPMHKLAPGKGPFHVLNLALNLVGGSRLDWQQRKATSFTVTPLHCGAYNVGYRPSAGYGKGITLGTAMAISGAAASPNMGYYSSPAVGAIMTLFNARLGSWLGNPGTPGNRTWRQPAPHSAVSSIIKEALGKTSDQSEYVYLSDGGHFENLALYEMVRRRCRTIMVIDGGGDPDFHYEDLGNALRKIRIDMGISIDFEEEHIRPLKAQQRRCAVGTIRYSDIDGLGTDGQLIYIKPMLLNNENIDILSYAATHPAFPHQSTADQWFDESQTESYRSLGRHSIDDMCRGWNGGSLDDLYRHLRDTYIVDSAQDSVTTPVTHSSS